MSLFYANQRAEYSSRQSFFESEKMCVPFANYCFAKWIITIIFWHHLNLSIRLIAGISSICSVLTNWAHADLNGIHKDSYLRRAKCAHLMIYSLYTFEQQIFDTEKGNRNASKEIGTNTQKNLKQHIFINVIMKTSVQNCVHVFLPLVILFVFRIFLFPRSRRQI